MPLLSLVLLALGLAMDAFAVAVASGVIIQKMRVRHALLIALFFGLFQAVMPVIGWELGRVARAYVSAYAHYLAFGLLAFIGAKMILEARQELDEARVANPTNLYILFILALATSIDAFGVGVTLSLLGETILRPVLVIGAVTFLMSFAGTYIGDTFGHVFERKLETLAGIVLIGIGTKILVEHTLLV